MRPPTLPRDVAPTPSRGSVCWLWVTGAQALCTCALLALLVWNSGRSTELHIAALIGIVASWSLALRTIRERLVELIRHWQKSSQGFLQRVSFSGRHWIAQPLTEAKESYIKGSIWRLRIIAAGLTLPFFVMPLVWSFLSIYLSFKQRTTGSEWSEMAIFTMLGAAVVGGYFRWAIVPDVALARQAVSQRIERIRK